MTWDIGKRYDLTATYGGISPEGYIILLDVQADDGTPFKDHVWLPYGKKFKNLEPGDQLKFTAKVNYYHHYKVKRLTLTNIAITSVPERTIAAS